MSIPILDYSTQLIDLRQKSILRKVRVVDLDTGDVQPKTDIVVEDGRISAIAASISSTDFTPELDCDGLFILPTFVNAHDHLYSRELRDPLPGMTIADMRAWLDTRDPYQTLLTMHRSATKQLRQGIGVIRDLGAKHGMGVVLGSSIERGLLHAPQVLSSGRPIVMTGGHVWSFGREADGPWECRRAVREQAKAGARVIKIMGSGGLSHYPAEDFRATQFTDDELIAIIDEAHQHGLPTAAHVFGGQAVARTVEHGIDSVEHGVEADDETLERMARQGTYYVPTLTNMERIASPELNDAAGVPDRSPVLTDQIVAPHRDTVRRAIGAGVKIAIGTDSLGDYQLELERVAELGAGTLGALRSAVQHGAELCKAGEPKIRPGARAMFSLFGTNPVEDLTIATRPEAVACNGVLSAFGSDTSSRLAGQRTGPGSGDPA